METKEFNVIRTAWDFTQKSASWIRRELSVTGLRTWKELKGESCISIEELPHKQSICTSRSFPGIGLDKLKDMEEAISNFAASCSKKLRKSHIACRNMTVFAYTSRFRSDIPGDYLSFSYTFLVATNDLQEIVSATMKGLKVHWKGDGKYFYKKAGVLVWDICRENEIQGNLFDTIDREKQRKLMETIDEINRENGHDAIRVASQGYSRNWHLKNVHLSLHYTTNWEELIRLKV